MSHLFLMFHNKMHLIVFIISNGSFSDNNEPDNSKYNIDYILTSKGISTSNNIYNLMVGKLMVLAIY